ncbi:MAG: hypothetical protein QMD13_00180 [Candidatus Bathyarchaeia archaeon]|nr:hypothetical protein [Candidatus Bathyarchaeia archaeon]
MGLFDIFISEETCPNCNQRGEMEFQTKALLNCLCRWKKGEIVETGELVIKNGVIKDCLSSCPKCKASLTGDIVIETINFLESEI